MLGRVQVEQEGITMFLASPSGYLTARELLEISPLWSLAIDFSITFGGLTIAQSQGFSNLRSPSEVQ